MLQKWGRGGTLIVAASAVYLLSLFLPWVDVFIGSANGFSTDGKFGILLFAYPLYTVLADKSMHKISGLLSSAGAVVLTIYFYTEASSPFGNLAGSGLYLAIISSVILLVGAFLKSKES